MRQNRPKTIQTLAGLMLVAIAASVWAPHVSVLAESTQFSQRILPLNCIFESVNDGTGTVRYITPAECGQIVPEIPTGITQPSGGEPAIIGRTPSRSSTFTESQGSGGGTITSQPIAPEDTSAPKPKTAQNNAESFDTPKNWFHRHRTAIVRVAGVSLLAVLCVLIFIILV